MILLTVIVIDDEATWDRFVQESPDSSIFHRWRFLRNVEKYSGFRLYPFGVFNKEELVSVFPVFFKQQWPIRLVSAPPPQTGIPYLGPAMSPAFSGMKPSTREACLQEVVNGITAEIDRLSPNFVHIKLMPGQRDIRPFLWNLYTEATNFTYFIDLDRPLEDILRSFDRNARRFIRDSEKAQLTLKRVADVDRFFAMMRRRYGEQQLTFPLPGPEYLRDLLAAFPEDMRMYFVYRGAEIAALAVLCRHKGRMIHWMGNAKTGSEVAGNEFLIWESIKQAKAEGCSEYEMQGAGTRRLWRFKSKFNPRLEVCYAVSKKDPLGRLAEWGYFNIKRRALGRGLATADTSV